MQFVMVSEGKMLDYTPGTDVAAGDVVVIGTIPHVATEPIAAGVQGAITADGVGDVVKAEEAFTAGDAVYWDDNGNPYGGEALSGAATGTAAGNYLMGYAWADAGTTDSVVRVKLTAARRTTTIAGSCTATDLTGSDSSLGIGGQAAAQGGAIVVTGGTSSTAANAGGAVSVVGGTPGAEGVGGAVSVTGGAGGSTSGTGGAASIAGGAGTAGNANGGAVTVLGGNAHGSGTDGTISIGTSNTSGITIGASGILTTTAGPIQDRSTSAVTATVGGGTTGLIPAGCKLAIVTSDTATKQISLPAASVGDVINILVTGAACELISSVAAHKVNEVTVGTTNELALVQDSYYTCRYVATNKWIVTGETKLGARESALVPDAL